MWSGWVRSSRNWTIEVLKQLSVSCIENGKLTEPLLQVVSNVVDGCLAVCFAMVDEDHDVDHYVTLRVP